MRANQSQSRVRCRLATCLVSAGSHHSTPVSRFFDVARFWREMLPVLPRLDDGKLGLINAKRVQRALRACLLTDSAFQPSDRRLSRSHGRCSSGRCA